jgi:hypothetical protein
MLRFSLNFLPDCATERAMLLLSVLELGVSYPLPEIGYLIQFLCDCVSALRKMSLVPQVKLPKIS